MAKKFSLPEKPCHLGGKVLTTGDGEGNDREELVKFSLDGLMLSAKDLDKLLGAGAHERLFAKGKSDAIAPAFGDDVNELKLAHRYVDSTVTLSLDGETVTLPKAKIMNVVLQPQIGGMTWMSCDVEAPTALADGVDKVSRHGDLKIAAQLQVGQKPVLDKRQKELPMPDANVEADGDAGERQKRNGRQPAGAH